MFEPDLIYETAWSGAEGWTNKPGARGCGLSSYIGPSSLQMTMPSGMENGEVLTLKSPLTPMMIRKIQDQLAGGARDTYIMKALGVSSWDIKKVRSGEIS